MIEFLEGTLLEKNPTHAVLQAGGFGFRLPIPLSAYDSLPLPGKPVRLLTRLIIREDEWVLFGFASESERHMFDLLISVSGIGPKIALAVLSGLRLRDLKIAIVDSDIKRLSSITGIGKKTAERMVVELRDKLGKSEILELSSDDKPIDNRLRDAILALVGLGYKQQEARAMIEKIPGHDDPSMTVEDLLRKALAAR
jgi:Holliday junction DNA helicase RuvA